MKKCLTILLVVALVVAAVTAGAAGYIWYRNNHVFVQGDAYPITAQSLDLREQPITKAYYDELHALLPGCQVLWNVPFQGGFHPSDTQKLTVGSLSQADAQDLAYFPQLKTLEIPAVQADTDYSLLESIQKTYPDCEILYQVNLGGKSYPLDTATLDLMPGEYTLEALTKNLGHLPQVETVIQRVDGPVDPALEEAYPHIDFQYIVTILGQEYGQDTTQIDLSALTAADIDTVGAQLALLPNLETVELMGEDGSQLTLEEVSALQALAPETAFHYSFDFYGQTLSTTDQEVILTGKSIGQEGLPQVRQVLDLMQNCQRFVLENCKIPNEDLAKLREDYRGKTNIVWRVYFGDGGSCLTDREVIKAVYGLKDSNSKDLIYCEGARYCDFGHNEYLNNCDFVAGMPNLEAIILSGSPIKSLKPFEGLKKLEFLEIAFCGYIDDVSPLSGCESLKMLNISATKVKDLSPLYDLGLTHLSAKNPKTTQQDRDTFLEKNPDCWASFQSEGDAVQPYGKGWRYDENNEYLPYYAKLRSKEIFDYAVIMNTTRW